RGRGRGETRCDRDAQVQDSGGREKARQESANAPMRLQGNRPAIRRASQLDFTGVELAAMEPMAATAARLTTLRLLALSGSSSLRASAGSFLAITCASSRVACSFETNMLGWSTSC